MRIKNSLTVLLVLCPFVLQAQDASHIDSLYRALNDYEVKHKKSNPTDYTLSDSVKVNILLELSHSLLETGDLEQAEKMPLEGLSISQTIGYKKGVADALFNIGNIKMSQGNYTDALKELQEALAVYHQIKDQEGLANTHYMMGNVHYGQGNQPEALGEYITALKLYEVLGDTFGIAVAHGNIGNVNADLGNYDEALKGYEASLKSSEALGLKRLASFSYNNIGTIYFDQGKYTEALKQHEISLKLKKEIGDKNGEAYSYNNIAAIHHIQGNYNEALKVQNTALALFEETSDQDGAASSLNYLGATRIKLGNAKEAKHWLNRGLLLAQEIGSKEEIRNSYKWLSEADSALGNFKGAYEHFKLYNLYRDSIINDNNIKKTVQMQMQYDFDKKEAAAIAEQDKKNAIALKELQRQKLIRNGFVGGFALVLLFAGIFFKQRNKIKKGKKRSDELLLNILPEEVAEELKAKGSAEAKQFDEVTVMFTDFKGFTQISEKLSPAELVAEIHTCFKAFDHIIGKHNIEKIKTIGDSYMCAGGLPVANTTNAADVVNAAMEIQEFMQAHLVQRQKEQKEPFEIRIGIHTGPVVAGIVGVKKFAYDIWGDTVNIASRMESSGEAGKVNISGSTYELVKDKFTCTYRGKILAKNKGEIDMYFVVS